MRTIVQARGLLKRYGKVQALDGLDLAVAEGSVLGLLGPNGAGKTTAVSILTTLVRPDAGTATVAGADVVSEPARVRERIGVAFPAPFGPSSPSTHPSPTARSRPSRA